METKTTFTVEGMSCGHCSNAVEAIIQGLDGIVEVEVDLGAKEARVSYNPDATDPKAIIDNINSSNIYKAKQK